MCILNVDKFSVLLNSDIFLKTRFVPLSFFFYRKQGSKHKRWCLRLIVYNSIDSAECDFHYEVTSIWEISEYTEQGFHLK